MDGLFVVIAAMVLLFIYRPVSEQEAVAAGAIPVEHIQLNNRLNPEMIHDEDAFMLIAHELGFR